jgi:hypothetical protein
MRALELTGLIQATRYTMYIITSSVIVALPASVLLDVAAWAQVFAWVQVRVRGRVRLRATGFHQSVRSETTKWVMINLSLVGSNHQSSRLRRPVSTSRETVNGSEPIKSTSAT